MFTHINLPGIRALKLLQYVIANLRGSVYIMHTVEYICN